MTVKVDGEVIPDEAINYELSRLVQFYSQHMPADELRAQMDILRKRAEDQAIGAKLLIKEAERLDIKVEEADVEAKLQEMIDNVGDRAEFEKMLTSQNILEDALRESVVRGRKVDLLVEKITEGVPDPTESELQEHFKAHSREYCKPEQAQAQHILVSAASEKEEDKQTAKSKLQEIRAKIEEGADFGEMAAAHSACPSGKKAGGSLGWFSRGMMVPEFDEAVFSLKIGELSQVVETSFGYHIVRKTGHESGGEGTFEESRESVRDFLRHARRGEAISVYVNDLKSKAVIESD